MWVQFPPKWSIVRQPYQLAIVVAQLKCVSAPPRLPEKLAPFLNCFFFLGRTNGGFRFLWFSFYYMAQSSMEFPTTYRNKIAGIMQPWQSPFLGFTILPNFTSMQYLRCRLFIFLPDSQFALMEEPQFQTLRPHTMPIALSPKTVYSIASFLRHSQAIASLRTSFRGKLYADSSLKQTLSKHLRLGSKKAEQQLMKRGAVDPQSYLFYAVV